MAVASSRARSYAVLFINIENLGDINAVQGHSVGDQVLQVLARRLREHCQSALCIGRWGDEEFAVLQPSDFADEAAVLAGADAVIAKLAAPIALQHTTQRIRACIGVAGVPIHTRCQDRDQVRGARGASGQAAGRRHVVPVPLRLGRPRRISLSAAGGAARSHGYRCAAPELSTGHRHQAGLRAQARSPGALATPDARPDIAGQFINLAEESGDMPRLGQWILRRACREARQLVGRCCARVAVNVSMQQLLHERFPGAAG